MPLNVAHRTEKGNTYKTVVGNEECSIHPSSFILVERK